MHIQINTDRHIQAQQELISKVNITLKNALSRISDHITRVEVHLSDENGDKGGLGDKRCMLEARMEGRKPVAVSHQAETLDKAVDGATEKLVKLIDSTLSRLHDQKKHRKDPFSSE